MSSSRSSDGDGHVGAARVSVSRAARATVERDAENFILQ